MPNIPNLQGLHGLQERSEAAASEATEDTAILDALNLTDVKNDRTSRRFGRPDAASKPSDGTSRSMPAGKQYLTVLDQRQSFACGTAFYKCQNGFTGCCSVDPCDPGSTCSDTKSTSTEAPAAPATSETTEPAASITAASTAHTTAHKTTTKGASSAGTATATPKILTETTGTAKSASSTAIASSVPSCPVGNGTTYTDTLKTTYVVHCNADNSFSSDQTITVGTGGYSQCFSACSNTSTCAGFAYVGLDSGSCYLKSQMPSDTYVQKAGSNYISCAKVNPADVAVQPTSTSSPAATHTPGSSKGSTGAIAGGVVGGILFLILGLVLVALLARRRRKKVEQKRATISHVQGGPMEPERDMSLPMHQRQGSTGHDVFAPYGGFYRGTGSVAVPGRSPTKYSQNGSPKADGSGKSYPYMAQPPPPTPPRYQPNQEGGLYLPASVYKRRSNPSADTVAMLDSTPIPRPSSRTSSTRSPRFHEHLPEMADTSPHTPTAAKSPVSRQISARQMDSPTLGREAGLSRNGNLTYHRNGSTSTTLAEEVRRRQHLMSWDAYDDSNGMKPGDEEVGGTMEPKTPPSARGPGTISPDESDLPIDRRFIVSPPGSLDHGQR